VRVNQAHRQGMELLAVADALELVLRDAQHSDGCLVAQREWLAQRIENDQRWLEDIERLIALREAP